MIRNQDLVQLEQFGLILPDAVDYLKMEVAHNIDLAMDAQPQAVTTTSAGFPAYFSNYVDPKLIEIVFAPMRGAELLGEEKKGDWITRTATFMMLEAAGEVSSYGDWNNNGTVSLNPDFPTRQSYTYQTVTTWGDRQLAQAGAAKIQWAAKLTEASVLILNKFQNRSYFYGIAGLENYGYLTDPNLLPATVASTKAAGGTSWANATPLEQTNDVIAIVNQLRVQTLGLIDSDAKLVIGMSPSRLGYLSRPNEFGLTALKLIKDQYPSIRIVQAVEYGDDGTSAVQIMQVFVESLNGQETGTAAYTEKLRAHGVVRDLSASKEKKSQGTWGAIVFLPIAVASLTGI